MTVPAPTANLPAGIYTLDASSYHADQLRDQPTLSCGIAKILLTRSPLHAWAAHPKLNPDYVRKDESKFDLGTVVHQLLLEGIENVEIIEADNWTTKAAKEARDEARANGRTPMLAGNYANAVQMVDAIRRQADALNLNPPMLTEAGKPEQTVVWEEDGVWCRARIDWLHDDYTTCDDIKTTSASAENGAWSRAMTGFGADLQCAFYKRGIRAVTGSDPEFRFLVAENYQPYAISVNSLGPAALSLAEAKIDRAIATWRRCLTTNQWPGYPKQVAYADLQPWEETRFLEREMREEQAA